MSTQSPPAAAKPPRRFFGFLLLQRKPGDVIVYHHSGLFYWWPVWLLGFICAIITVVEGHHMALVPENTQTAADRKIMVPDDKGGETEETRDVLILPKGKLLVKHKDVDGHEVAYQPVILMSRFKGLGALFVIVLLLVTVITNVPMRGLWSVLVIVTVLMLTIILAVGGWWETILAHMRLLAIHINFAGYLVIALTLFIVWTFNFFVFDRQTYMVFSPGQVRIRIEVGGAETVYDTTGMTVQKQRGDLFRHLILGFGSGDLILRPSGSQHAIEMPNVLSVGRKVTQIERMMKERVVIGEK